MAEVRSRILFAVALLAVPVSLHADPGGAPANDDPVKLGLTVLGAALAVIGGMFSFGWQTRHKRRTARQYLRKDVRALLQVAEELLLPFNEASADAEFLKKRIAETRIGLRNFGWLASSITMLDLTREAGHSFEVRNLRSAQQDAMGPLEEVLDDKKHPMKDAQGLVKALAVLEPSMRHIVQRCRAADAALA